MQECALPYRQLRKGRWATIITGEIVLPHTHPGKLENKITPLPLCTVEQTALTLKRTAK